MTTTRVQMNPESGEFEDANNAPSTSNGFVNPDGVEKAPSTIRTNAGVTYRATSGASGEASESTTTRMNTADMRSGHPGLLATARTAWGSPASQLTPQTRVTLVDGSDTTLAAAEKMGLVARAPDGTYREVQQAEAEPETKNSAPDLTPVPLSDGTTITAHELHAHTDEVMNASMKGLDQFSQEQIVQRFAMDKLDEKFIHDTARANGLEPEDLAERVEAFQLAVLAELAPVAERTGVADLEHFAEWADENYGEDEMMDAFMAHVYGRDTSKYAGMMEEYVRRVLPRTEEVEKGGVKVAHGTDGKELVNIGGVQMSLKAAVRQGLIK